MKRFLVILFLIPSIAFGAYTEFYCDATNGSNLFSGSSTNASPYTKTSGNWVQGTRVYTVQDGTNPSSSVNVGDFASVYPNGASAPAVYIGRITAVQNANNGTITIDSAAVMGAAPANSTGGETIVVGGPWKGPNAASAFPFSFSGMGTARDSSSNPMRVNMKNNSTYSITSSMIWQNATNPWVVQGYASSVGDGGKATIDGGTSTAGVMGDIGLSSNCVTDIIFTTSFTTGSTNMIATLRSANFVRCVFKGARGYGISLANNSQMTECEVYDCNKSNTLAQGGVVAGDGVRLLRCIIHDNAGSNSSGVVQSGGGCFYQNCVFDTNGQYGINFTTFSSTGGNYISGCDFYNNTSDGIHSSSVSWGQQIWVENSNFIKNGGSAIIMGGKAQGFSYNNGYGAGTQANGSGDTLLNTAESGKVTYASNVTPWVDPANGDFRINLPAAMSVGRGAFQQTQGYSSPNTVGYPDIGAADHADTCAGLGPCQTSGASAQ